MDKKLLYYLTPVIYLVGGIILYSIIKFIVKRAFKRKHKLKMNEKTYNKLFTGAKFILNCVKAVIFIIVLCLILSHFGVNVKGLVAGLSILGLVVGLALQDILKDLISGAAIIADGSFALGDIVKIGDFAGIVQDIGLRTTKVKGDNGDVLIVHNKDINKVINSSFNKKEAYLEIELSSSLEYEKINKAVDKIRATLKKDVNGHIKYLGITSTDNKYQIINLVMSIRPEEEKIIKEKIIDGLKKEDISLSPERLKFTYEEDAK